MLRNPFVRKKELHYALCISGRFPALPLSGVAGDKLPDDIIEQLRRGEDKHRELVREYCEHRGVGYW